jgi:hypothetical protein
MTKIIINQIQPRGLKKRNLMSFQIMLEIHFHNMKKMVGMVILMVRPQELMQEEYLKIAIINYLKLIAMEIQLLIENLMSIIKFKDKPEMPKDLFKEAMVLFIIQIIIIKHL